MIFCIDIDETLCHSIEDDYAHSTPCEKAIRKVNELYQAGHTIKLFTGRGSWDSYDWRTFTKRQLESWGVKYHELIMNKPYADVFIDDKAINVSDWLDNELEEVKKVSRDWGEEVWLVNCDEYCAKLLYLPKGSRAGDHYHIKKKETFYCLKGQVIVVVEGKEFVMNFHGRPLTIRPNEVHTFRGVTNAILLEVSTHHEENDVVFLSEGTHGR